MIPPLNVSWTKVKVQAFGGLLDVCGEDDNLVESFTYLGSVVHNNGKSDHEVIWPTGLAYSVMDSLNTSMWRCQ